MMVFMRRPLCVAWIVLAAGAAVSMPARLHAQRPVFRSGTELATIDVRVVDKDGAPIPDLQPDEIRVTDDGAVRPVVHLRHVTGRNDAAPDSRLPGGLSTNSNFSRRTPPREIAWQCTACRGQARRCRSRRIWPP
jgi:hypothetical protein